MKTKMVRMRLADVLICSTASHGYDAVTLKYNAVGQVAWTNEVHTELKWELARSIRLDGDGNVVIGGDQFGLGRNPDFHVIKISPAGSTLWSRTYDGPAGKEDELSGMVVDPFGNTIVTGRSQGSGTNWDYATVKYDSAGNVLWTKRFTAGLGLDHDEPSDIALENDGSVLVTGSSTGSNAGGRQTDFLTIKYSQGAVVAPSSFSLFRGVLFAGGLSDLASSDGNRMVLRPGLTLNQQEAPVQLILNGAAPLPSVTDFRFKLEANASTVGLNQSIELFDWLANAYVQVDSHAVGTADAVTVGSGTNSARFIQSGTNAVKARLSWRTVRPVLSYPWSVGIDQAVWIRGS